MRAHDSSQWTNGANFDLNDVFTQTSAFGYDVAVVVGQQTVKIGSGVCTGGQTDSQFMLSPTVSATEKTTLVRRGRRVDLFRIGTFTDSSTGVVTNYHGYLKRQ